MIEIDKNGKISEIKKELENNQKIAKKFELPDPKFMAQFAKSSRDRLIYRDDTLGIKPKFSFGKYTKEQIINYLKTPDKYEKQLREVSVFLYTVSNQYKSIVNYNANMLLFAYVIVPLIDTTLEIDEEQFLVEYNAIKKYTNMMNIDHEFNIVTNICYKEDVFYGYIIEGKDTWSLMKLDPNYCRLSARTLDNCWLYQFDFKYFSGQEGLLDFLPKEFKQKYNQYLNDNTLRWQLLEEENEICIKANETEEWIVPPFCTLFSDIADINAYKDMNLTSAELENTKIVHLQNPINEHGNALIDADLAKQYYYQFAENMPEQVAVGMTPFKVTDIKFDRTNTLKTNEAAEAEEAAIRAAGINPMVFGAGKTPSAAAVSMSIVTNSMNVFRILKQIERNINRKLRYVSKSQLFKITMLSVTHFTKKDYIDYLLKMGQYGQPIRSALNACAGFSQMEMEGLMYLENTIVKLPENEHPLTSSNVQSGKTESADTGGRPSNESQNIVSDTSAEQTENDGGNEKTSFSDKKGDVMFIKEKQNKFLYTSDLKTKEYLDINKYNLMTEIKSKDGIIYVYENKPDMKFDKELGLEILYSNRIII